jgi:hypothetical protein
MIPRWNDVTEIASLLLGIAFVALLIGKSSDTATVIKSASEGFGNLIGMVTLQGNRFGG